MSNIDKLVTLLNGSRSREFTPELLNSFLEVLDLKLVSTKEATDTTDSVASITGELCKNLAILSDWDFRGNRYATDVSDYISKGDYKSAQREFASMAIHIDSRTADVYKDAYRTAAGLIGQLMVLLEKR